MGRTAEERAIARAERLESLIASDPRRDVDQMARRERHRLWTPRQPQTIRVRPGLLLYGKRDISPIRQIEASKSAALQLLLMCIFEEQCRPPDRIGQPTTIPLRDRIEDDGTSWRYLLALPTFNRLGSRTVARNPADNRVNQIKTALTRLESCGRVELRPNGTRNRYERFRLQNEATDNSAATVAYRAPQSKEYTIEIPIQFFLNGWVHALTDSEIITYLYMLHRAQKDPTKNAGEGMEISAAAWSEAFGERARGYEAYRFLYRYGLIGILRDIRRRADGTVEGFSEEEREGPQIGTEPHRFKVDLARLGRNAVPIVAKSVRDFAADLDYDLANWFSDSETPVIAKSANLASRE